MPDKISTQHRSWVMSRVVGKHTKPERIVRSLLHRIGYRFTVNGPKNRRLPGRPDIVLPRRQAVIFVHGCFWHRHPGCKHATTPKSNVPYWVAKFARNVQRDCENEAKLRELGWQVIVVWECELKDLAATIARLVAELPRSEPCELPESLDDQQLVAETRAAYRRSQKSPIGRRRKTSS